MKPVIKTAAAGLLGAVGLAAAASALDGAFVSPSGMTVTFGAEALNVLLVDGTMIDIPAASDASEGRAVYSTDTIEVTLEGDTLTVSNAADPSCPGVVGVYTFAESDDGLTFTAVSDDCAGRHADMTSGVWPKAE